MRRPQGRLTDELNRVETLDLSAASVADRPISDPAADRALAIDLQAVLIVLPNDDVPSARRIHTRRCLVDVALDGLIVRGELHAPGSADPLTNLHRRGPFVPITEAMVFDAASGDLLETGRVAIVNLLAASSVRPAGDESPADWAPEG